MAKKITEEGGGEVTPPSLVTVRVTGQPVGEDHGTYTKGETFETTAERAEALGSLVEIFETTAERAEALGSLVEIVTAE